MRKAGLYILMCLAVAANLLVPQRLLFYNACCYGDDGRLLPDSAMKCKKKVGAERISGPDCCAPRECVLRAAPPSDSLVQGRQAPARVDHSALLPAWCNLPCCATPHPAPPRVACTGPPGNAGLLTLQSRLNL